MNETQTSGSPKNHDISWFRPQTLIADSIQELETPVKKSQTKIYVFKMNKPNLSTLNLFFWP
jgi:hypothetical protein